MSTQQHPDPVTLAAFPRHTARAKARMVSAFSVAQAHQKQMQIDGQATPSDN